MSVGLSIIAAIVPMMIYPIFIYWMDRFEKEPLTLVAAAFLWGFIPAAIISLISQLIFGLPFLLIDDTGTLNELVGTVLLAPVTEEIAKGAALLIIYLLLRNEFDDVFDGIVYGSLVGFGFAAIENVLYFTLYYPGDASVVLIRSVVFGLNHALFTSLTGIGFGVARQASKGVVKFLAPLAGLIAAMGLHMLHNASTVLPGGICIAILADYGGVLIVFLVMVFSARRQRTWITRYLEDEVALETLSQADYDVVRAPFQRWLTQTSALMRRGPAYWWSRRKYLQVLTDLAFEKHLKARGAQADDTQIAAMRKRAQEANAVIEDEG